MIRVARVTWNYTLDSLINNLETIKILKTEQAIVSAKADLHYYI